MFGQLGANQSSGALAVVEDFHVCVLGFCSCVCFLNAQLREQGPGFDLQFEPLSWELDTDDNRSHTLKLVVRSYYSTLLLGEKVLLSRVFRE
jgi:hypothetical protein